MTQSKAEIKAIQAKLQAIRAGRSSGQFASTLPPMVELTPPAAPQCNSATATLPSPPPSDPRQAATALQERVMAYLEQMQQMQQMQQAYSRTPVASNRQPPASLDAAKLRAEAIERLETQAHRINALSKAQEAALLELKAIAERLEREEQDTEQWDPLTPPEEKFPICQYLAATVPYIERGSNGAYVLTTRDVDLFRAEREATLNARTLRQRTAKPHARTVGRSENQRRSSSSSVAADVASLRRTVSKAIGLIGRSLLAFQAPAPSLKTARSHHPLQSAQPATLPDFSIQDAVLWVLGAVVVRVALDLLLIAHPGLWLPVVGLIVLPAAIAVYRATVAPQSGFMWGYRLLLIMIGLLIGGRL